MSPLHINRATDPRFVGILALQNEVPKRLTSTDLMCIDFQSGLVAHAPDIDCYQSGDSITIACGSPRFLDARTDKISRSRGTAAAWELALRTEGVDAPKQVHGRYSVVQVRSTEKEVILATDRFGTWPICYSASDNQFSFSDRADTVLSQSRQLSNQAIFDYLFFHVIPGPATIFEGVVRAPAASITKWSNGKLSTSVYWVPEYSYRDTRSLATSADEFLDLLRNAVARETSSSSSTAAFLSGGTDSSTVAGMLSQLNQSSVSTYSIGFDATGYDEMEYARIASNHFGTDHHEYYVTPDDLLAGIPNIATFYDQPFGNSSAVPAWICASLAKKDGFSKVLAGDGGDELFGGNTRYAQQRLFGVYEKIPQFARSKVLEPVLMSSGAQRIPGLRKVSSYVKQARVPLPDRLHTYNLLLRIGVAEVLEPEFVRSIDVEHPLHSQQQLWRRTKAPSVLDHLLSFEWQHTLVDNDLPKVIGTGRLAGIDIGFPLLDDDLVRFSQSIPPQWKLKGLKLRWFFKEALKDFLPEEILQKKKHGFGLPFGIWACSNAGLLALSRDSLDGLVRRGIVNRTFADKLLDELLPAFPGYYGEMVWILVVLELWLQNQHSL